MSDSQAERRASDLPSSAQPKSGVIKREIKAETGRELTDDELDAVAAAGTDDGFGRARGNTDGT